MSLSVSEVIDHSPELVWAVVTDWSKARYWLGVENLRPLEEGSVGEGTRLIFSARGQAQPMTITRWQPNEALTLESPQGGLTAVYEYSFSEQEGSTRVELRAQCTANGRFWKLVLPVLSWLLVRSERGQLAALKRATDALVAAAEKQADALEASREIQSGNRQAR